MLNTIHPKDANSDNVSMSACSVCGKRHSARIFRGKPICAGCIKFIKEHY